MTKIESSQGFEKREYESPKALVTNSDLINVQSTDELSKGTNTNPKNTRGITPQIKKASLKELEKTNPTPLLKGRMGLRNKSNTEKVSH